MSQSFGEQVNNLIIGSDSKIFDFPMMDLFTKMMIAYIVMLCVRSKFGELSSKAPALSSNMCGADELEIMIPNLFYQVHIGIISLREESMAMYSALVVESATCVCSLKALETGQLA